ncbi:MAG TPA: sigma-54 dependent transcriptional regulator [Gemmatimonadaceae bacterium]|nr:sigma-54 dependent transcriptional regulator [Gemmatimonadaceae bacterium]
MKGRRAKILIVDDEELLRQWLAEQLRGLGFDVVTAGSRAEALRVAEQAMPAAVLLDLRLPDCKGLEALEDLHRLDRDLVVIMMTAYGEVETAVAAVRAGAYHFLQKPLAFEQLAVTLNAALEARRLRSEVAGFRQIQKSLAPVNVIARSGAMRRVMEWVDKVAAADPATVLLQGESGTGKDLIAHAIHQRSPRRDAPCLAVTCTAIPDALFESELFGHERGAFSDARERKRGLLELAEGGVVVLDEIGDVSLGVQAKLLSFLETRTFRRVGGLTDIEVDVRIVAATNRNLADQVAERAFRLDLYHRINVLPITLPPLRERPEDVEPLALHFLEEFCRRFHRRIPTLLPDTLAALKAYSWPGNVRELRNVIERLVLLEDGETIAPEQLPLEVCWQGPPLATGSGAGSGVAQLPAEGVDLEELERSLIAQALRAAGGNKSRAARLLRLTRDTLRYRLEKYGLG